MAVSSSLGIPFDVRLYTRWRLVALLCLVGFLCAQTPAEPRAARSVHLRYVGAPSVVFYNELTVEESAPGSYFVACGFRHGYFGIQEFGPDRNKVVLFSVWDPGARNDPASVPGNQRVRATYNAADVVVRRFGGEGTGGQSFFYYDWKIGQTYKFMVRATTQGDKTSFAAWFFLNETKVWKHLATFRTITGGTLLSGFYSFIEDFRRDGKSLRERRAARFGNGWARAADGVWTALSEARLTADRTPVDNFDGGVRDDDFFLATGGDTVKHTELEFIIRRPLGDHRPPDLN
jgi:hypothetical protein